MERKEIAGVVAIAIDRIRVLYQGAFGTADLASGAPMRMDTMFRIASMTKPVTSLAAAQLMEQGHFTLEDPVGRYLPQVEEPQVFESFDAATGAYTLRPASRAITVRHLFTHTSGLGYAFTSPIVRDFKARAGDEYPVGPLLFEPGERWLYGTSVDWLGRLVEKVSGMQLEDYLQKNIFGPLQMADTSYFVQADKQARVATVSRRTADGAMVKDMDQPPLTDFTPIGGSGLCSTAIDYSKFIRMMLNDGRIDGARLLKPNGIAQMGRNQIGSIGVPAIKSAQPDRSDDFSFIADGRDKWGLGFLITADALPGQRSSGSLSWGGIFNTYFWIDPAKGLGGAILMQFLPFADRKALALYRQFERGVYLTA